jgi:hypothetical protein
MLQLTVVYQGNPEDLHSAFPIVIDGLLSGPAQQKVSARERKNNSKENLLKSNRTEK